MLAALPPGHYDGNVLYDDADAERRECLVSEVIVKTLNSPPKFLIYAVIRAIRHPLTSIRYYYCPDCKLRFNAKEGGCPKCHSKVDSSPENRNESPIPWWGSFLCIIVGIVAWIASALLNITPLGEAARLLVYAPIGHLFGLSLKK